MYLPVLNLPMDTEYLRKAFSIVEVHCGFYAIKRNNAIRSNPKPPLVCNQQIPYLFHTAIYTCRKTTQKHFLCRLMYLLQYAKLPRTTPATYAHLIHIADVRMF